MKKRTIRRIFRYVLALISLSVLLFLFLFLLVYNGYFGEIPDKSDLSHISNSEATIVLDRNGVQLGKYYVQDRSTVSLDQISPHLLSALVQIEDQRFYAHHGIDFESLGRVLWKSILLNDASAGGGSTITQQLAKNVYPRVPHPYLYYAVNKLREMIIATRIERLYTKDEILLMYLNTVSFGLDTYGIEAASHRIFSKPALALSIDEAAVLVGMLKATTSYHPLLNPDNSLQRRNIILNELSKAGILNEAEVDSLLETPLTTRPSKNPSGEALYFLEQVKAEANRLLKDNVDYYNLSTDGLVIETTLDNQLQIYAERAVTEHLRSLQEKFLAQLDPEFWVRNQTILDIELRKRRNNSTDIATKRAMRVFSWEGDSLMDFSVQDSIKYYLQFLQAGFLANDPQTGEVLAWVGGIDPFHFSYDHVTSKRQVGSTFKPLIYATALENNINPCTYYDTEAVSYEFDGEQWRPENSGSIEDSELTMATALEKSVNTVTVKVLKEAGLTNTIETARRSGITSDIPAVPSIALGTPSISLFEMVGSYSAFANGGWNKPTSFVKSIKNAAGEVIYQQPVKERVEVFEERTGKIMIRFLQEVVNSGTASELRSSYKVMNDLGGKTGTSQNNADGWFIGISPKMVAGAWVGGEYPAISFTSSRYGQGARMALPIYARFYQLINKDPKYRGISQARFSPLPQEYQDQIDCDPFKEEFKLWEWLRNLGKRKDRDAQAELDSTDQKPKFFDRLKSIFKKKK